MTTKIRFLIVGIFTLFAAISCSKEDSSGNVLLNEDDILRRAESRFNFTPNQNFEAIYLVRRVGSQLDWYFRFNNDGTLDVLVTTDTNDDFSFQGSYTYTNDQINIQLAGGNTMPFPNGINESTTEIMPQMGLVAAFATDQMVGICIGHGYNTQQPPRSNANYGCPEINQQQETSEDNAIELVHSAVPFGFPVTGSIFRQQDRIVNRTTNPIITRGYGIYRQSGNEFYATFRIAEDFADFARGRLPFQVGTINSPFDDFNVLSGRIENNGTELIVDQLEPDAGPCQLR